MGYSRGMPFTPFRPDRPEAMRRRFRLIPVRTLLPNVITLLALCAGLTAIRLAVEEKLEWAVAAIVFAALLDGIDGRVARMLKGTSRFGAELDSLADFVNFGVAPALMLYFWGLHEMGNGGWIAAMVFAICTGLRLARFNVMIDDPNRPPWAGNFFTGVPAPVDDAVVEFLQQRATAAGVLKAHSTLVVGTAVQVTTGPLAGLSGILQNPPDAKGRVRLLMKLLDRDLKVMVPLHSVKSGWMIATTAERAEALGSARY